MKECYFAHNTFIKYIQSVNTTCDESITKAYGQKIK